MSNLINHGLILKRNSEELAALLDFIECRKSDILAEIDDLGTLKPVLKKIEESQVFDCRLSRQ